MEAKAEMGAEAELEIVVDDPRREVVHALLITHLEFTRSATPVQYSYALDVDELVSPTVTFFSARSAGRVVGVAALKHLDDTHAELKSMHTLESARKRGIGRAMVEHLLVFAERRGYRRVSLETGSTKEFVPARSLYAHCGFKPCEAFGAYVASPYNTFMTIDLDSKGSSPQE